MLRSRSTGFVGAAAAALLLSAGTTFAQTPAPGPTGPTGPTATAPKEQRIAAGVTAGGIDVSGLLVDEAKAKIASEATPRLTKTLVVRSAGRRLTWSPTKHGKLKLDALRSAKRAYYAGQNAKGKPVAVPLAVTYLRSSINAFVDRVQKRVTIAARDASVSIRLRSIGRVRSRPGRTIDNAALRKQLKAVVPELAPSRLVIPKIVRLRPRVTTAQLASRYGTIITVDKSNFRLRLFKRLKLVKSYGVAVGQPAYPTPSGLFSITSKQVNPTWSVPNSPWAGELRGTTVAGGSAANPLKARWMGIVNGVGIHGTGESGSIGSRASHGCIRMRVPDVIALYNRVPLGTPVLLK